MTFLNVMKQREKEEFVSKMLEKHQYSTIDSIINFSMTILDKLIPGEQATFKDQLPKMILENLYQNMVDAFLVTSGSGTGGGK